MISLSVRNGFFWRSAPRRATAKGALLGTGLIVIFDCIAWSVWYVVLYLVRATTRSN